jgi:acyl transferase domain-containing protein
MFPGQGAQHIDMGRELYDSEPLFRREVDESCEVLAPVLDVDLRSILFPTPENAEEAQHRLTQTSVTQPALFVVEHALARLWMSWGLRPAAMIGHSLGEYVAACIGGTFSRDIALQLLAQRARLMQGLPSGSMLAIKASPEKLAGFLSETTSVAAFNSPTLVVVSGEHEPVADLQQKLSKESIACRRLHTSHAFHSAMMEPILDEFAEVVRASAPKAPVQPWISNVTGTLITENQATDPHYWMQQLRQPVRFADGLRNIDDGLALLEVGPGGALGSFARQLGTARRRSVFASLPMEQSAAGALEQMLTAVGQ